MPWRTECIVRLLQFALGWNWRRWCCECVAGLGKERKAVGEVTHGAESGRRIEDGRGMLPWLGKGLAVRMYWQC